MPRARLLVGVALAFVGSLAAVVVIVSLVGRGSGGESKSPRTDPITATTTLSPRVLLFGDTVTATVDVVLDNSVIDPGGVNVSWSHAPWAEVGRPQRTRREAGSTTYLRTMYVLRCLTTQCVPLKETELVELPPAKVTYVAEVGDRARRLSLDAPWPSPVLHTRLGQSEGDRRDPLSAPWRADFVSLPDVSYRVAPGLLLALLVAGGCALLFASAVLAFRALPRRQPPPEPEPPPPPVVTPLEQALLLLESAATSNGAAQRRRALELVAGELEVWGETSLAHSARELAWSDDAPETEATRRIAALVRSRIEEDSGRVLA